MGYGKAGMSTVVDFAANEVNSYPHVGFGVSSSPQGGSFSIGLIDNYAGADSYAP